MQKNKFSFILLIFFSISAFLSAETFRVSKMHTLEIQQDINSEAKAILGINESLAIFLPTDKEFIEGIEIKMDIPDTIAEWMDSVACSVYDNVKPKPSTTQIDYSANRQFVSTLPGRLSWVLQIPFIKNNSFKENKYTTKMDTIPNLSQNIIFIRLQPIMKGIPEETSNSKIKITVKPIFLNKGKLNLKLNSKEELQPCSIYIDDKSVPFSEKTQDIILDTGIHNISIISETYRNEVRTVRIDQAKTTSLLVEMKSIEPTLIVIAPEGANVTLDNEDFTNFNTEIPISEGEHKINFSIGNYEISKTINVIKGKTYTANFTIDVEISEE